MKTLNRLQNVFIIFGLMSACLLISDISAEENLEAGGGKPMIILKYTLHGPLRCENEITNSHGYRNPSFVLYDDGLVIFKKGKDLCRLFSVKLTQGEMNGFLKNFDFGQEFMELKENYFTSREFHQPLNTIYYWKSENLKKVMVSGVLRTNEEHRNQTPKVFLKNFDAIIDFDNERIQPWVPNQFFIRLYPIDMGEGDPVQWPQEWPDMHHALTKEDPDFEGKYLVYFDGKDKDKFEQFYSKLENYNAVLINDKEWYVAPIRHILPKEGIWIDY